MNTSAAEISAYLKHGDYAVAVRRTLDLSLDSGDDLLIEKAINWSRKFHESEKLKNDNTLPDNFVEEAENILQNLSATDTNLAQQNRQLISAENISKSYRNGNFSLKPISLAIETGDVLGVVLYSCLYSEANVPLGHSK